ncbi:MAG: aryl-sulfate sulfotransferase [Bdellovibrionales bacterium]|nr:aryl-sulfate sulfotransferase [Bdellovibrionales bacterium]
MLHKLFFYLLLFCLLTSCEQKKTYERSNSHILIKNTEKSWPGFTLYPLHGKQEIHLLNTNGEIVHKWPVGAVRAQLLENCNLIAIHNPTKLKKLIREYDWQGNIVWEYKASSAAHHDVTRLKNGNTLFPIRTQLKLVPEELKENPNAVKRNYRSDSLLEVTPNGKIVWRWNTEDHLDINSCGKRPCKRSLGNKQFIDDALDWTHVNTVRPLPENKWFDQGDQRFKPGNIIFLPRNWSTVFIIDKETKEIVWKYEGNYKKGLILPHESHMIASDLPGAGNILIFDNGKKKLREASIALEINPVTKEVIWSYEDSEFYSGSAGSLQRLPNGNTLISQDTAGRVFEVTPEKEIVWEYSGIPHCRRAKRYSKNYCPNFKEL